MTEITGFLAEHTWIATVFGIVLATLLVRYIVKRVLDRVARQLEKTSTLWDDAMLAAARKPLGWAIYIVGLSSAAEIAIARAADTEMLGYIGPAREVAVIFLLAWFAVRVASFVETHVAENAERAVDKTTATAIGKLVRASIIITAVLTALQTMGFSIAGVLAFGGIGGIAIGFAARDLLANFFGALMIFLDRPFSVGEWVRSPDRNIEGTVEEIGWRLTTIRTFDQRPLYVPNSIFQTLALENPSKMRNRRIYETIGVRYDDVAALKPIIDEVRAMLQEHPEIDTSRTLMVNFVSFGASSLDFFVYTFTKTTVWTEFHAIKEDVLFKIADIIARHGAEVAFPTQTILLGEDPEPNATAA